jgi:hypothetical protein
MNEINLAIVTWYVFTTGDSVRPEQNVVFAWQVFVHVGDLTQNWIVMNWRDVLINLVCYALPAVSTAERICRKWDILVKWWSENRNMGMVLTSQKYFFCIDPKIKNTWTCDEKEGKIVESDCSIILPVLCIYIYIYIYIYILVWVQSEVQCLLSEGQQYKHVFVL